MDRLPSYASILSGIESRATCHDPIGSVEDGIAQLETCLAELRQSLDGGDLSLERLFRLAGISARLIHDGTARTPSGRRLIPLRSES